MGSIVSLCLEVHEEGDGATWASSLPLLHLAWCPLCPSSLSPCAEQARSGQGGAGTEWGSSWEHMFSDGGKGATFPGCEWNSVRGEAATIIPQAPVLTLGKVLQILR